MQQFIVLPEGMWALRFSVTIEAAEGTLFSLSAEDGEVLTAGRTGSCISVRLKTHWQQNTQRYGENPVFEFTLSAPQGGSSFELMWLDASVRLYADGQLTDEDWPLGTPAQGELCLSAACGVTVEPVRPLHSIPGIPEAGFSGSAQYYTPPYYNASAGDCMPFSHNGRYRLFYLFDRRHHGSKQGLGAHQWGQISSENLTDWTIHPIALGINEQWEGSVCTGSMIEYNGLIYAFYAVRMADGSPARLTWAVSEDGVHFEKSGRYFSLTAPYEPISARDPKVFAGADGLFHMLVTTSLTDGRTYDGCLAHLVSDSLTSWTQLEPMVVPGYPGQPECSDYFEWNGLYYLIFSNSLCGYYLVSDQPFGPWRRLEDHIVVSPALSVPKTACIGGRRLVTGWLANRGWGGSILTYELIQRADGSLGVKYIDEIMPALPEPHISGAICAAQGIEASLADAEGSFRLRGTLDISSHTAAASLSLDFASQQYRLIFEPSEGCISLCRPEKTLLHVDSIHRITRIGGMDRPFAIDLIIKDDVLTLMLPDGRLFLPPRLDHAGPCRITLFCRDGSCRFTPDPTAR